MKLYDYELSGSCYKVRLLLSMLGLPYEKVAIDYYPGREHRKPAFLQINPLGQLPALEDGDLVLRDAQAILLYLSARYDDESRWFPKDPAAQGRIAMWLAFAGGELMALSAARLHEMLMGYENIDIAQARRDGHRALQLMDQHLAEAEMAGHLWIAAAHPTIADIACFPYAALSHDGGVERSAYHHVNRWLRRFKQLPGFVVMPGVPAYG
jgi:glutathione S-transferase